MEKKYMIMIISFFLINLLLPLSICERTITENEDTASISGFIINIKMNPIDGAKISLSCGEEYFECYSNETGYYHKEGLPLLYCIWNITVFKQYYESAYIEMPITQNSTCNFTLISLDNVELEVEIFRGFSFPAPTISVTNNGKIPAYNVRIKNVEANGRILYNNRESQIAEVIEPNEFVIDSVNSWFIGFGLFNITISVSCDEGMFISDKINGLIVGSFILIP